MNPETENHILEEISKWNPSLSTDQIKQMFNEISNHMNLDSIDLIDHEIFFKYFENIFRASVAFTHKNLITYISNINVSQDKILNVINPMSVINDALSKATAIIENPILKKIIMWPYG